MANRFFIDLTGRQFGRLVVLCRVNNDKHGNAKWRCLCECGQSVEILGASLRSGNTQSCGCLQREDSTKNPKHITHGQSRSAEYRIWADMRSRCRNVNNQKYGGRGIKVCRRWESFDNFLIDMGRRPSPKHSIDRKNVNGNYTPTNCRWATPEEQSNNKRDSVRLTFGGITLTLAQWARRTGINYGTLYKRYQLGWNTERVLENV